jgi:hypothetical protein
VSAEEMRDSAKYSGNDLGKAMTDLHGSSDKAKETLFNPMLSASPMSTLGNSWKCPTTGNGYVTIEKCSEQCAETCVEYTFDFELQCASQTDVLTVNPVNFLSGGDVQLNVSYDSDMDGISDSSFTTLPISGFCTNGYVSCSSGTWSGCRYFEFGIKHSCGGDTYDTLRECKDSCEGVCEPVENHVRAVERSYLQMRHAGGCFCSNASCGSAFNNVYSEALGYFGGGITSHLMNELNILISDTEFSTESMSLKYMAAAPSSCTETNDDISSLKRSYQTGQIDYDSELVNQTSDPDSIFNTVMAQSGEPTETHACSITNTPMSASNPAEIIRVVVGQEGNDYWSGSCAQFAQSTQFYIEDLSEVTEFKLTRLVFDDWIKVSINGHVAYVGPYGGDRLNLQDGRVYYAEGTSGSCELGKSWNYSVDVDIKPYLVSGLNTADIEVIVSGNGEGYAYLTGVIGGRDRISVTRSDACAPYAKQDSCSLYEETINEDFDIVLNYSPTGILPQSTCIDYEGTSGKYILCDYGDRIDIKSSLIYAQTVSGYQTIPDSTVITVSARNDGLERFRIDRTYICEAEGYDFSDAKAQADMIGSTIDRDSGDFIYLDDGSASSGNVYVEKDGFDSCTYSCVVQTGDSDTEVFPDQQTRPNTNTVITEERPCGVDRNTLMRTCPYDQTAETLLTDCSCTDHFTEVITTFGMLYEAAKDIICSKD